MDNNKPKVLIIEDNLVNINILIDTLSNSGYKILIAENGDIGIKRAIYAIPDIILLDIMMPGIDGYEVCRKLKENSTTMEIPIIFVSALTEVDDKIEGFNAGAVDFITKPFQKEEVLARIETHLTLQSQKKELKNLNTKLNELNSTKDRFFSILAHDIRGAFSPLLFSAESLYNISKDFDNKNMQKITKILHSSAINVNNLMDNLLRWGKIQRGMYNFNPGCFDLYNIVANAVNLHIENALQKNISLSHEIEKNTLIYVDSNMIGAVFRNLISNALKYTKSLGKVTIKSKSLNNDFYSITLKDTGVGIDSDKIDKLFQVDRGFKTNGTSGETGTGLGLVLCKEFISLNGGSITVESKIGVGTSFNLKLKKYSKTI